MITQGDKQYVTQGDFFVKADFFRRFADGDSILSHFSFNINVSSEFIGDKC